MDGVHVANAPVSFGVFELADDAASLPSPDDLAGAVAGGGYAGIDLGPAGYLGAGSALGQRLARHELGLAGGFVQMGFSDPDAFASDMGALDEALDLFEAASGAGIAGPRPKPTLADAGSPARRAHPGRGSEVPECRLGDAEWKGFAARVGIAADRVRERGFEPTFHHHACSYVEAPGEIERLLESTDVDLCLDTGHLLLGGGDPLAGLTAWGSRINHLHVKDCRRAVVDAIVAERAGMRDVWSRGTFCALGAGDLDIAGFLDAVAAIGFAGWLVVEQDMLAGPETRVAAAAAEQTANRRRLASYGF